MVPPNDTLDLDALTDGINKAGELVIEVAESIDDMRTAIIAKNVDVPAGTGLKDYAAKIDAIQAGSGGLDFSFLPFEGVAAGDLVKGDLCVGIKDTGEIHISSQFKAAGYVLDPSAFKGFGRAKADYSAGDTAEMDIIIST